jgi:hypothetical protein
MTEKTGLRRQKTERDATGRFGIGKDGAELGFVWHEIYLGFGCVKGLQFRICEVFGRRRGEPVRDQ